MTVWFLLLKTMADIPKLKMRSGNSIPRLGLGTWMLGGSFYRNPDNDDKGQIRAIRYALDNGIAFIRTAQNYAGGYCEELIGKAIKGYRRSNLFITSCINERFATSSEKLVEIAQGSLKRLKIDYFDLYLVGGVNPYISIKEVAEGLLKIKEMKLTEDIGVANYRLEELKLIEDYTNQQIVYDEMHYNLVVREVEMSGIQDYCRENKIILSAYRPLQFGQLAKPGVKVLDFMVKKYNKSQAQIALKWVLSKGDNVAIPKSENVKHLKENLKIFNWELQKKDIERLDKHFPVQMRISDCTPPKSFIK